VSGLVGSDAKTFWNWAIAAFASPVYQYAVPRSVRTELSPG
jgi:hypothetical protein